MFEKSGRLPLFEKCITPIHRFILNLNWIRGKSIRDKTTPKFFKDLSRGVTCT